MYHVFDVVENHSTKVSSLNRKQVKDLIFDLRLITKLEIRSVERGICPIATSTMNELIL